MAIRALCFHAEALLAVATVLVTIAILIDDPPTTLATLIWFGDEGHGHAIRPHPPVGRARILIPPNP